MPTPRHIVVTAALLLLGLSGGLAAQLLGLPLPFLLGSLLSAAPVAIFAQARLPVGYGFPPGLRVPFIGLIGAVIGAQVTPALVRSLHDLLPSLAAILVFVIAAQGLNYLIFRRLGGYDRATAFFSGAPGGLIESIALGESHGADEKRLVTQQFLRIILVITLVPLGLSLWLGYPVGSAGGLSFTSGSVTPQMYPLALVIITAGGVLGRALHLPAWQLTGALALSAGFSLAGLPLSLPDPLIFAAQIVVGVSLGMRFAGLSLPMLGKGVWLSLVSVAAMTLLGAGLALALLTVMDQPFDVLLITFAPGGVNEMALIALSIGANPAFVTLHHVFRIVVTVFVLGFAAARMDRLPRSN